MLLEIIRFMTSKDVYLELAIVFVVYFLIINFSKSLGEQLIFMFVAFTLSNIISSMFITGIKGFVNHPLIARIRGNPEKQQEVRIHEMRYLFLVFFAFIIGSTVAGTVFSATLVNEFLFPSVGAVQGELLISGIITLATYVQMLYLFGEKLVNRTSIGIMCIIIFMVILFIFFGGYAQEAISYFGTSFHMLARYSELVK